TTTRNTRAVERPPVSRVRSSNAEAPNAELSARLTAACFASGIAAGVMYRTGIHSPRSPASAMNIDALRSSYTAVIVGARCAGAATAMLLARAGMDVLVIERDAKGADTLSTLAMMRAGVLQLSRWGLLDAIRNAGTPRIETTTFHYGAEQIEIRIKPRDGVDG